MRDLEKLKEIKERKKYTFQEMANKMGVAMHTVFRWANGYSRPSPMAIKIIRDYIKKEN